MEKEDIIRYLASKKKDFEQEFGVTRIGIFGSYAKNREREDSDLDVVVEMNKPDLLAMVGVKQAIEEDLGIEVDIIRNRKRMNQKLKKRINKDAVYV